ncbi:hypothetical protein MM300_13715 [Evansella sp. LMS18]|jgi:ABC-type transport system involved in cytochrome bd biosynthesis fused ATPase/permease subunit|uniref:hypothetical protein n=1 Tax=Evansella sp. LMS18 TaxID=2924033 RepID=UPI0020D0B126|nr:hypothetical protein [Evansella sp. LMS18]UTR08987.1 hypothetical protein MM300_13715 [Evansella sp. LMS18]
MNTFFDTLWVGFPIFLIAVSIIAVTFLLSFFIKNNIALFAVVIILILGTSLIINQMQYTTFQELYSDQLNEDSDIRSISVAVNDLSVRTPETAARTTIEDESLIGDILNDFQKIELRKDNDAGIRKYTIGVTVNNQVKENFSRTTTIYIEMDDEYLNEYKIVSAKKHLETIESLDGIDNF